MLTNNGFMEETMILTDVGYKCIKDIKIGDKIFTNDNKYMPITEIIKTSNQSICQLVAMGGLPIYATSDSEFLVITRTKKHNNKLRKYEYVFSNPYKKKLIDIKPGMDFLCSPILQIEENPYHLTKEVCWLLGRYVADGCFTKNNQAVISVGKDKVEEFELNTNYFNFYKSKITKTNTYNYILKDKQLNEFIQNSHFNSLALDKQIPNFILNLPIDLLKCFIDGYFAGDGSYIKRYDVYQATTISFNLSITLQLAIQKIYHVGCRRYFTKRSHEYIIQGRVVNQHDTYLIRFTKELKKQRQYYVKDNFILYPIKKIESINHICDVYNINILDGYQYLLQNFLIYNI